MPLRLLVNHPDEQIVCSTCNLIIIQSQQSGIIKKSMSHLIKINIQQSQTANFGFHLPARLDG